MELIDWDIPANCEIVDTGDLHYGALNCARHSIQEMIDYVAAGKNRYMIVKGDALECILPNDKRYSHLSVDFANQLQTPGEQRKAIIKDFEPIKKKIIAFGMGNHEYKLINTDDFAKSIAEGLGCPYGSVMFKVRFHDKAGKVVFKTFHWHGSGKVPSGAKDPIQRKANRKAWLKRKLEHLSGDTVLMSMGHGHHSLQVDPTTSEQLYLTDNGKQIKQHYRTDSSQNAQYIAPESRFYSMTPSFLKLFSPPGSGAVSYGELAGYEPSEIGYHKIIVEDYKVVRVEEVML